MWFPKLSFYIPVLLCDWLRSIKSKVDLFSVYQTYHEAGEITVERCFFFRLEYYWYRFLKFWPWSSLTTILSSSSCLHQISKQHLQTVKERFQAFLSGDTQIVADEAFINAVQSYYEVSLGSKSLVTPIIRSATSILIRPIQSSYCLTLVWIIWTDLISTYILII